ncbi:MAG: DNA translocase FtsK [Dehalococcoidales bacterium]|nr:DNA translocase FtsK [Dehalococcoidales bacterium]
MTRRSVSSRRSHEPRRSGGVSQFTARLLWIFIFLIIAAVLIWVFRAEINDFFLNVFAAIGWGIIFVAGFILMVLILTLRRNLSSFFYYWNIWLGIFVFVFAIWGILGLLRYTQAALTPNGLGGSFGAALVANPAPGAGGTGIGILCLFAYIILGFLFVMPRQTWNAVKGFFGGIWSLFTAKQAPRPPVQPTGLPQQQYQTTSTTPVVNRQEYPPAEIEERKYTPEKPSPIITAPFKPSRDIHQVAEDVWKKYGKSGKLVEIDGWRLPPIDILDTSPEFQFSEEDNLQRAQLIENTLSSYGVDAKVVQINAGPTVTQFGVEPGWDIKYREVRDRDRDGKIQVRREEISKTRVKVERINSLSNDLALALAAPTIRIEAPVPGKSYIGVEVPNTTSDMVSLRGVVETGAYQKLVAKSKMALALGKGAGGESIAADLTKMPHLLIAGATGSGKTVCLNTIVCALLLNNTPNEVRFILIDPKRVELTQYNSIPHLATPVIVDTDKALNALRWLCQEMDKRYKQMAGAGARNIEGYNKDKRGEEKMPYMVLVVDELADLMMAGYDEVETNLCRLAQLARATGIHLVVATQRPSVDVVTGLIKANFPTRISFAVTSAVDSRTILDGAGAEKLLGRGDMLYMPTEAAKPKRIQGCFLSDTEIERLVYFWGGQRQQEPDKLRMETLIATAPVGTIGGHPRDPLLEQAKALANEYSEVSTSFLQRKLHIGYPRAARLKEQLDAVLEEEGIEPGSAKPEDPNDNIM